MKLCELREGEYAEFLNGECGYIERIEKENGMIFVVTKGVFPESFRNRYMTVGMNEDSDICRYFAQVGCRKIRDKRVTDLSSDKNKNIDKETVGKINELVTTVNELKDTLYRKGVI